MTVTITGSVTVGGRQYPVQCQVDLPAARGSDRSENPVPLRVVPRAG